MKVIIYSHNYDPEPIGIAKYNGELVDWFINRGHDVRVVTAIPNYPHWKIYKNYKNFWSVSETQKLSTHQGVLKVYRCPIWIPKEPNGVKRVLHLVSFSISSLPVMLLQVLWKPQVIIILEPPLFIAPCGLITSVLAGAKSVLHIQDYEVDAAFNLGFLKGALLKKLALNFESWIMRKFDVVSSISKKMIELAIQKGVHPQNLYLLPNWVNLKQYESSEIIKSKIDYRVLLDIPGDAVVVLYSGSMVEKQGLEILYELCHLYSKLISENKPNIHFVFCGNGPVKKRLKFECRGMNFVHFLDLQPIDELANFLTFADIHLLPQRADVQDLVMPSKLTGMLASGNAIIATANPDSELFEIVKQVGLVVPPSNPRLFLEALLMLAKDKKLRKTFGSAAKKYAHSNLDINRLLIDFESYLLRKSSIDHEKN